MQTYKPTNLSHSLKSPVTTQLSHSFTKPQPTTTMKLSLLTLITAAATGILAAPAPAPDAAVLDKRHNGYLRLCTSQNLKGDCGNITSNNKCFTVKKNDQASSMYIKNAHCNLYEDSNCKGRKVKVTAGSGPRTSWQMNLSDVVHGLNWLEGEDWDNRISSVICWDY